MSMSELLRKVARRGPHHLEFYALIAKLAAQLHLLTSRASMLYVNYKSTAVRRSINSEYISPEIK